MSIMIAGGFDPLHSGHLDHIKEADLLAMRRGERLLIVLQSDANLIAKKGYCLMPYAERRAVLRALRWPMEVVPNVDDDGTVNASLELYRPNVYAKGGDRTPENMPPSEVETCKRLGIELRYGIGDLLNSSSRLGRNVALALMDKAGCPLSCPARQDIQGKDGQGKRGHNGAE